MTAQSRELRVRPIDRPPVLTEDPVARMVRQAAEQGVELEVTFRAKAMTSANAPRRKPVEATYLGSRERMSPAAHALYQREVALARRNPRQGVMPQRRIRTTVAIAAALVAAAVAAVIVAVLAIGFLVSTMSGVSARAIAVGLVVAALVAFGGATAVKHCPGAFHR